MLVQGEVQQSVAPVRQSGNPNLNQDQLGNLSVSEILPRYAAVTWSGLTFSAAQPTAAALTAAGTTTTGLTLWNPTGSGKNAVLIDVSAAFTPVTLATVAVAVWLAGAAQPSIPTFGTALTPLSNLVNSSFASSMKCGTGSSTIANSPVGLRCIGSWEATVETTSGGAAIALAAIKDEVAGCVIVPPGAVLTLFGVGTVADGTVSAAYTWIELPV